MFSVGDLRVGKRPWEESIAATRVLILSDATSTYRAMSVVRCLDAADIDVFVLSAGGSAAFGLSRRCRASATLSRDDLVRDDQATTDRINELVVGWKIDVVVPVDLESVLCVSRTSDRMQCAVFPVAPTELLATMNDKWSFTRLVRDLGLLTPATVTLDQLSADSPNAFAGPLLVKPRAMEAGVGVARVASIGEALALRSRIRKPADWVVQEYVPGEDIDFSVLASSGRIIAHTVEARPSPGCVEFTTDPEVFRIGARIVTGTKFTGAANFDLRRDARDGSVRVIESNPLLWDTVGAPAEFGLNFPALGVLMALGLELPEIRRLTDGLWLTPRRLVGELLDVRRKPRASPESWLSLRRVIADPFPWIYELLIEPRSVRRLRREFELERSTSRLS
ncbi:MAG: ATP-grasp domain-containing protein [Chloroflexota bacterium]|nr:ATP-grasp domain-containing protein [Chloroflexota bacterium]